MTARANQPTSLHFAFADADVVLRTTDLEFRVHRRALACWSPYWRSTFCSNCSSTFYQLNGNGVPTVCVNEDATTIDFLLRHIYPRVGGTQPELDSSNALKVLKAARKYGIDTAIRDAKTVVDEFVTRYPLHAYEGAVHERMEDEMRMAAAAALALPPEYVFDSLTVPRHLSPESHSRLVAYYRECVKAALEPINNLLWMADIAERDGWDPVWARCSSCPKTFGTAAWYWRYFHTVRSALSRAPCRRTLCNSALTAETLRVAGACPTCAGSVHSDLDRFNDLLGGRVELAVAHIRLEVGR